jgi:hypothetical protein
LNRGVHFPSQGRQCFAEFHLGKIVDIDGSIAVNLVDFRAGFPEARCKGLAIRKV